MPRFVLSSLLENWNGNALPNEGYLDCTNMPNGTYYYVLNPGTGQWRFQPITNAINNSELANAVIEARCLDTETAKVSATVRSLRPLTPAFQYGDYWINKDKNQRAVSFELDRVGSGKHVIFWLDANDKVLRYTDAGMTHKEINDLFRFLDAGDVEAFEAAMDDGVYMTDANLRAAFGFAYSQSDSATWAANSTPIILDPTVSIPKTGDNASVIGFAMIMVAVVAAAVAVRKVNA